MFVLIWETWVQSLGWEDHLKKGMVTHISILAWRIPWTEEPGRLQYMGLQRDRHNWVTNNIIQYNIVSLKVTVLTPDFPTWGSGKGTENPQGI